jgi:hypothetical protein
MFYISLLCLRFRLAWPYQRRTNRFGRGCEHLVGYVRIRPAPSGLTARYESAIYVIFRPLSIAHKKNGAERRGRGGGEWSSLGPRKDLLYPDCLNFQADSAAILYQKTGPRIEEEEGEELPDPVKIYYIRILLICKPFLLENACIAVGILVAFIHYAIQREAKRKR